MMYENLEHLDDPHPDHPGLTRGDVLALEYWMFINSKKVMDAQKRLKEDKDDPHFVFARWLIERGKITDWPEGEGMNDEMPRD